MHALDSHHRAHRAVLLDGDAVDSAGEALGRALRIGPRGGDQLDRSRVRLLTRSGTPNGRMFRQPADNFSR
jgi:hypothetical protein